MIERKSGGGTFSEITAVGPNVTEYNDSGLTQATTYQYIIRRSVDIIIMLIYVAAILSAIRDRSNNSS
jgi:hypothetical protein